MSYYKGYEFQYTSTLVLEKRDYAKKEKRKKELLSSKFINCLKGPSGSMS
jgi:hypothetical protein